ncbi:MAG TPA: Asp-tRNA(Asn)/Glu-tRNA(Gln) amidotransferase subunit GatB [Acinetobacter ursingii]|uniref:Aspartyl/glutamyl-tRNA(Asn/Gln) amidotransferase subunit B n=1 Tax=Acinetobacter ursingii TaxID=108980 RepID=A0A3D2SLL3_9GAMM|nr:Asp-tRNA(Asn)/Glu-tRNA(Gln) amidotransferase subunit GatB [Acinetobacter ursingii]MCH2005531.1 Asp-tRNA(Asn)/Glu-tRNA(Gln) amidotransferase subunit GatB [Acinetobacter ursingii]MCU4305665.1 Asp-tRNA(Asn)/Glu-tRNA(Gln) amidotransferase subunit GatB [Acinetobacter ursingii]MCU4371596.1 Asp-tRNA(Asn)/Glu-tRNA(Gln) amidotransferase subunit GatB [Acinetobacter ursingii]MCU4381664.1 Asp-tRNA(Asn)/Glu-tRNA(Gln) amidotransferase subunit GatB [Acinetobacter ursingii]MCU4608421.1 Asp-tRNA(Asn)/Glu-tR
MNDTSKAAQKLKLIDGWEVVIGIEIHTQLATQSKIFSGSSTEFGQDPNTQASLVDLAMPGVLPVLNAEVVNLAIRFGLGIDAYIDQASVFARKNYFYPDSPKGYQISQMDNPIVGLGHIDIQLEDGEVKRIGVTRAHLEEDAGKSIHDQFEGQSGIDLNRAGTPLLEIVSEPDMRSVDEAVAYIKSIHTLVRWLGISDGNMAEGSFRADCNVSLRRPGDAFGTRCELKNLNSFRFIEQAINVEIERQMEILEYGGSIDQETRLFDPNKMETRSMRSKEEANDYRYFPDPDLLPVIIADEQIEAIKATMPELPAARRERFIADFAVTEYDAHVLTLSREMADFYEAVVAASGGAIQGKIAANWVMGEFSGALNKAGLELADSPVSAEQLGGMIARIVDNTINGKIAKQVFGFMWEAEGKSADDIISEKGLKQETDTGAIEAIIKDVLAANEKMVEEYKSGKEKAFNGLVGQVMKAAKGKANPAQVNELMKKLIG